MLGRPAPKQPLLITPNGIVVRRSTDVLAVNHEPCRLALKFIQENLGRNIGVREVAEASGIPRRSLEEAFRKQLSRSIREEIGRLRLAKVHELLVQTDLPVVDIAALAGFNTPQYLNLVFREAFGIPPRKFRSSRRLEA
jgi:LacI family transcriptional regulator